MMERTVSEVIIEQLSKWGVEYVFGLPGTSCLGLVDALRSHQKVRFVRVRHEEVAALMASAYAKLTGKVGVCLSIAGPGATNLVTGLYDAKMDRAPVLALTGQVKLQYIGPGSFQEIDQDALFDPISVFNKTVASPQQTVELVTLALKHAITDRGVSHLSIPNDVQKQPLEMEIKPIVGRIPNFAIEPSQPLLEKALDLIDRSKHPVIIAGWGARGQGKDLLKLAEKIAAPIATTFRGKGIIPENQTLCVGVLGKTGTPVARKIVNQADLLLVLGSSFSEQTSIPPLPTIQVDIDPINLGKTSPVRIPIWANITTVLPNLIDKVKPKDTGQILADLIEVKKRWQKQLEKESDPRKTPIRPPYIMRVLQDLIDSEAIISLDVGDNGFWLGRNFTMSRQTLLMSGYLATMGFGLPGALVAKLVTPGRQVICVTGDGGFSQVMGDFLTAVENNLTIVVVILNNKELAMISTEQKMENYPKYATELKNLDFSEYAKSCGGVGFKVRRPEDLRATVEHAFETNRPTIIDIETDPRRF